MSSFFTDAVEIFFGQRWLRPHPTQKIAGTPMCALEQTRRERDGSIADQSPMRLHLDSIHTDYLDTDVIWTDIPHLEALQQLYGHRHSNHIVSPATTVHFLYMYYHHMYPVQIAQQARQGKLKMKHSKLSRYVNKICHNFDRKETATVQSMVGQPSS